MSDSSILEPDLLNAASTPKKGSQIDLTDMALYESQDEGGLRRSTRKRRAPQHKDFDVQTPTKIPAQTPKRTNKSLKKEPEETLKVKFHS